MKITINRDSVLDGIYAESSLRAAAAVAPGGYVSRLLTRSQGPALRRILDDAVAIALAGLGPGWRLETPADSSSISIQAPDDLLLDPVTVETLFRAALGRLCLAVILGAGCAGSEVGHSAAARAMLDNLACRRVKLCSTDPCGI